MNTKPIDAIANAVLYEGYMLYPYRPSSVKNRQRFNFGVLYPKSYSEAQTGSDAWSMQTECLVEGRDPSIDRSKLRLRFLKLVDSFGAPSHRGRSAVGNASASEPVSTLEFDGKIFAPWQEASNVKSLSRPAISMHSRRSRLSGNSRFPRKEETELLRDAQRPSRGNDRAEAGIGLRDG